MTTPEPFNWEEGSPDLTPDGRARRDAILSLASRALGGRVRRRRLVRSASALALLALVCGGAYVAIGPSAGPGNRGGPSVAERPPRNADPAPVRVTFVRTDGSITARASIGDDELLRLLGEAGRPAGLVRVQGKTLLSTEIEPPTAETGPSRT